MSLDLRDAWSQLLERRALAPSLAPYTDLLERWARAAPAVPPRSWSERECRECWQRGVPLAVEVPPRIAAEEVEDLLGGAMEAAAAIYRPFRALRHSTTVVFLLGSVSAAAAVVAGYLLSLEGGYDPGLVRLHMWLGVAVLIGATATTLLKVRSQRRRRRGIGPVYVGVLAATMGVVSVTGHVGGSLTHGSGYLTQYLPGGLKRSEGLLHTPDGVVFPLAGASAPPAIVAARAAQDDALMKEHRRLFYVALTRARDRLCICGFHGVRGAAQDSR